MASDNGGRSKARCEFVAAMTFGDWVILLSVAATLSLLIFGGGKFGCSVSVKSTPNQQEPAP